MAQVLKDKIPPHNEEAEQAVLGAILLDERALSEVIRFLRPADFYTIQNQRIFTAALDLFNKGVKPDILTVEEELRRRSFLEQAGGASYIATLTDVVPSTANVEYYAGIVRDCSLRRSLLHVSGEIHTESFDETQEGRLILERAQQHLFDLTGERHDLSYEKADEFIENAIQEIERRFRSGKSITGIPSGFGGLDALTNGFQESELIIIGARPSIGKTAIALSMAAYSAIHEKIPTAFFTLEMSSVSLAMRLLSMEARIPGDKLRAGSLKPSNFKDLTEAAGRIYDAPLFFVDTPNMRLLDLTAQARRLASQEKVKIIFVDYISQIGAENLQIPRYEQVAEISRSLKGLARELSIPVVALSQLRRDAEGKQPSLADLRESGSIEQDADLVMFLHRERDTTKEKNPDGQPTELIIAKQRNGPIGAVDLVFIPKFAKFENITGQK